MAATKNNPAGRVWTSLRIEAEVELADAIGSFLLDAGAPGLQTEDVGARTTITAHFTNRDIEAETERFFDRLSEFFPDSARPSLRVESVEESDWAENWKQHFPPQTIGRRLFVHPPWTTASDIPDDRIGIVLDPGMAFGTGHHGSTRGCLTALDEIVDATAAPRVLDLGTGSGVLAIAAIKLGAASALAVDIDPEACEIAVDNCAINRVGSDVEVSTQLAEDRIDFDIIVANIFSGMLIGFANDIVRRLRPGGHAIGSGLETAEAEGVIDAWTEAGMERVSELNIEGWTTLVFRRK